MKLKWAVLILILAGIIAYANTAKNGLFWDDDEFITRNAYIRSFRYLPEWFSRPLTAGAGVNSNYYRPLLQLSLAIDYKLWGLWPAGYHLENLVWHTFAGILLFVFLSIFISVVSSEVERPSVSDKNINIASLDSSARRQLLARNDVSRARMIAFAASLLWLIHPIHTEAVAYANSRGDSMAAAFILLTLILWMKRRFWASAAAFILALLSKEFAIVTPGLIALVEFIKVRSWAKPRSDLFRLSKRLTPHFVIAAFYLLLRLTILNFQNTLNFYGSSPQRSNLCNPLELYAASLPARLMTFLKVLPIYGRILIWPDDLHMERTVEIATTIKDPIVLSSLAVILASAGFFGWALIFSTRKSAGTSEPRTRALATPANIYEVVAGEQVSVVRGKLLLFSSGWFFISIFPTSGIIPISQILAEHFLYLPSIGFFLIIGWLLVSLLSWVEQTLLTYRHSERSEESRRDCHAPPKAELAMTQMPLPGRLNDSNHLTLIHLVYWVILLGIFIPLVIKTIRQNRIWRDPITFYEYTLAHAKPTARVYNNLAMAYADAGEHQKAINNYQLAISLGDVYPNPHYNLGNTLIAIGKSDEAEKEYRRALEIDPNFHYATLKLGQMHIDRGKIDDAKKLVCPVFPTQPLCQQL